MVERARRVGGGQTKLGGERVQRAVMRAGDVEGVIRTCCERVS